MLYAARFVGALVIFDARRGAGAPTKMLSAAVSSVHRFISEIALTDKLLRYKTGVFSPTDIFIQARSMIMIPMMANAPNKRMPLNPANSRK